MAEATAVLEDAGLRAQRVRKPDLPMVMLLVIAMGMYKSFQNGGFFQVVTILVSGCNQQTSVSSCVPGRSVPEGSMPGEVKTSKDGTPYPGRTSVEPRQSV
jgi:hypothetical protein